jgi:DNA-binding response OmpR family regulator
MNGVELAIKLRELDPKVHVIVMTGHVGEIYDNLIAATREMSNVEIVAKPIKLKDLLARINEILQLRDTGRDN